jgi:hypothetical protein
MSEPTREPLDDARRATTVQAGSSPLMTLVSAGLFLYVGFGLGLVGVSGHPVYDGSVAVFTWGARIVGVGLLVVFGLEAAKLPGTVLLDLIVSVIAAGICLVAGAIWLAFGDLQGVLILLFGVFNGSAARAAWIRWRAHRALAAPSDDPPWGSPHE